MLMIPTGECPHDSIRAEIQQILIDHPRTRYAKVLLGMLRGLTDAEMAKEPPKQGNRSVPTALPMFAGWFACPWTTNLCRLRLMQRGKLDFFANC